MKNFTILLFLTHNSYVRIYGNNTAKLRQGDTLFMSRQNDEKNNTKKQPAAKGTVSEKGSRTAAGHKKKSPQSSSSSSVNLATMKKNASAEASACAKEKSKETTSYTEDNLELKRLSFRERIKIRHERFRQNMEGMSSKEKFSYFLYYYKWKLLFAIIFVILAITIPVTIYKNNRPVAISYAIINSHYPENINDDVFDDYMSFYGYTDRQQIITSNYSYLNLDTYEEDYAANSNNAAYTSLPMLCYNGYFDIIITDKTGLEYCAAQSLIQPLDSSLYPDVYKALSSGYKDSITTAANTSGIIKEYGIDISDTVFAKSLNLDYSDVYICFIGMTDRNLSNSRKIMNYIFSLNLDI